MVLVFNRTNTDGAFFKTELGIHKPTDRWQFPINYLTEVLIQVFTFKMYLREMVIIWWCLSPFQVT